MVEIETQQIFVPENHFKDVPESFTAESRITNVKSQLNTSGIILNSLKEVEYVLRVHNGEKEVTALSSLVTSLDLLKNMHEHAGETGVGLAVLARATLMQDVDFVGTMIAEAKSNLATKGQYQRSYDYDAMGSNFLKTTVKILKVGDKFILSLNAAYVGNKSEIELAMLLGRRIALSSIDIDVSLGVVDDWWYNLNPRLVLGDIIDFDDEGWINFAESLVGEHKNHNMLLRRNNELIELIFSTEYSNYQLNGESDRKPLIKAVGYNIAGAAWDAYRYNKEAAKVEEKKLHITVRSPAKGYKASPIIDPAKAELLITVAKEIEEKILKKVT